MDSFEYFIVSYKHAVVCFNMSWILPCGDWVHLGTYNGVDVCWGDVARGSRFIPNQVVVSWIKEWFDTYVRDEMIERHSDIDEHIIFMAWVRFGIREKIHTWDHDTWAINIQHMFEVNK